MGRADARQRPRLRDPRARAVQARRRDRPDRSDHRRPRARADPRRGAAPRAGHPAARQRRQHLRERHQRAGPAEHAAALARRRARPRRRRATRRRTRSPAADAAEVRRRLQGTLLTCSVYKRNPPDHGVDPIAVLFTADSLGDPKGVLRTDKNTIAAVDHAIAALGIDREDQGPRRGAAVPRLRLGPRLPADAQARLDDVPRGGDLARAGSAS